MYADVAGNEALNARICKMLGSRMVRNISLAVTNLSPAAESKYIMPTSGVTLAVSAGSNSMSGAPAVEFFFMPESMERSWGVERVLQKYGKMVKGRVGPEKGTGGRVACKRRRPGMA